MSVDLCILRQGVWEIHSTYQPSESEKAVQDAIRYKQEKAYVGVAVLDDRTKSVLYGFTSSGKPEFNIVQKSLKEGRQNMRVQQMKSQVKNVTKQEKEEKKPPLSPMAFIQTNSKLNSVVSVSMLSLVVAITIFMILLNLLDDVASAFVGALFTAISALIVFKFTHFDPSTSIESVAKAVAKRMQVTAPDMNELMQPESPETIQHMQQIVDACVDAIWDEEQGSAPDESALGIILLCSGVIEHIHQTEQQKRLLLIESMSDIIQSSKLSIPRPSIIACYKNILEYLAYPRYSSMYDMGYQTSKKHKETSDEGDLAAQAKRAFDYWQSHQEDGSAGNSAAAIFFTDIVDFTSTHQARGDTWMTRILNAHNEAVREGLQLTGGREIKHTGDGIMASFPSVKDALDAAIIAQKKIKTFNDSHKAESFEVRMGVSYGEPVHIGGDIFGTPVNKAARVLANTNGKEISLSDEAWQEAQTFGYTADEVSGLSLKGFDGVHSIFKVNWDDSE